MPQKLTLSLTEPQEEFAFSDAKYPALVGGLGCVHADTKIMTEYGLMRIADIDRPMRVLSWCEKDHKFQLSPCGGSFPKGRDYLYRVITTRGEFAAAGHHHVFSSNHNYVSVHSLFLKYSKGEILPSLLCSTLGFDRLLSISDAPNYLQTDVDYLGRCADESRLYGQRFLEDQDIGQSYSPLQAYARRFFHKIGLSFFLREGDSKELIPGRSHRGLLLSLFYRMGYAFRGVEPVAASEGHTSSSLAECISHSHQESRLSLLTFLSHRKAGIFSSLYLRLNSLLAFNSPVLFNERILKVLVEERKQTYYDMQVLDTHNYVCENGFIHHNSGKSQAGIARLLIKIFAKKGLYGGYYMPNYDLLELRAMSGFEEMLSGMGLPYTVNKSKYRIDLPHCQGGIIFRSYDRPERIVAYSVAHSVVDELDTLPKEKAEYVWRKISERNRQDCGIPNTIGVVTTPDQGYSGFVYQKWAKSTSNNYQVIKARTDSNPFLPDGYIEQITSNYDPVLADMYISGEFVSLSRNKVYHFFDRNKHHTSRKLTDNDKFIHVGIDFNVGGCCANVWVIENNMPIAVDEFVSHDTRDFCNSLASKYKMEGRKITVYPDASGKSGSTNSSQSDIDIIRQAGYSVDVPNVNPAIRDRINAFNGLLAHDRIKINTDTCPDLTDALESQGYDKKGDPEKFDTHPSIDDHVDSAGYFINKKFPINKPVLVTGIGSAR